MENQNRLEKLFQRKKDHVLNVYCTAGFPNIDSTLTVMKSLEENGADIIELGMPYSDPLADGPVIQSSSLRALRNGMTIRKLFEQLKEFRKTVNVPVLLMGYMNPVIQFGFEAFCKEAAELGIDGLIIPDLPIYEFETEYGEIIRKYNLDFIFLVTPETEENRIKKLDSLSTGFLYAVSSSSTTGKDKNFESVKNYLHRLNDLKLKNPILVGFGIKDKASYEDACEYANGAIIGTAFIKSIENSQDLKISTQNFLNNILN